jgi:predicted TIM-barrel fold metal-dependent hydrolase
LVDRAIEELEWVLDRGTRIVLMRPAPAWGFRGPRSFALPEFDPYWARVQESGVLVVIHASDTGYNRFSNEWEGVQEEAQAFAQPRPFSAAVGNDYRDIQDAVTSIIAHGLVTRFPDLRFALIENGAGTCSEPTGSSSDRTSRTSKVWPIPCPTSTNSTGCQTTTSARSWAAT